MIDMIKALSSIKPILNSLTLFKPSLGITLGINLGIGTVALLAWVFLAVISATTEVDFNALLAGSPIICPFRYLTGILCPGCGMTRAFVALMDFDPTTAFLLNPFSIPLFVFILLCSLKIRLLPSKRVESIFYAFQAAVLLVWWVPARLLPGLVELLSNPLISHASQ